ncbi:MAG: recombination protein RecR [Candidatus Magasanikbacteria bacterium]|nr:recombination protein RecR [Candidatus Magasanikbacteria bacterium]
MYSPSIERLLTALKKLPGVGAHTAERYIFHWLKSGKREVGELVLALKKLMETVKSCERCWNFSDASPCPICRDAKRDRTTVCVVAEPADLAALERTGAWRGLYHVLRGVIDATEAENLPKLKIKELLARVKTGEGKTKISEVVLALNPDLPGETTMLYLERELKRINPQLIITRLARGLPLGADLRYADDITLGNALSHRITR